MSLIGIAKVHLHDEAHFESSFGLFHDFDTINVFVFIVTLWTLYFKVIDDVLFDFGLSFIPDIGTKDWDQHATVDANSEQYYKGKEENHRDWVCTTCDDKTFVGSVVIAYVE